MHFDLDFGVPRALDAVTIDCSFDQWTLQLGLEGRPPGGGWKRLAVEARKSENAPLPDLRRAAVRQIAARGITHVLLHNTDFGAPDFRDRTADWGLRLLGEVEDWRLYAVN